MDWNKAFGVEHIFVNYIQEVKLLGLASRGLAGVQLTVHLLPNGRRHPNSNPCRQEMDKTRASDSHR